MYFFFTGITKLFGLRANIWKLKKKTMYKYFTNPIFYSICRDNCRDKNNIAPTSCGMETFSKQNHVSGQFTLVHEKWHYMFLGNQHNGGQSLEIYVIGSEPYCNLVSAHDVHRPAGKLALQNTCYWHDHSAQLKTGQGPNLTHWPEFAVCGLLF